MKFARDGNDYRKRLRQILPRFEISLLDYCQTSNHVHLLCRCEKADQISRFMQTLEDEFAQAPRISTAASPSGPKASR
jgi:REP element-mobilizing transposase RayT